MVFILGKVLILQCLAVTSKGFRECYLEQDPMTESSTRNFISQWPFDHSQEREDVQDETTTRWRSVNHVAERMRQWEEHQLELESDPMDFEARSAAIEARCFQTRRNETPESKPKSANITRKTARIRPQSATYARRSNEINGSSFAIAVQPRPTSAKTRLETAMDSSTAEAKDNVAWKVLAQEKSSKWRDMLARGPEFKQLSLRILELETYELLYKSLQQSQLAAKKPTRRRRRRREIGSSTGTIQGDNPTVPCGSAIHLARSRKKRQQEHDRRMMLGKSQRSPRTPSRREGNTLGVDQRVIQEKTRKRSSILKKKSQNQLQEHQPASYTSRQQRQEPSSQRQPSTYRTARAPWLLSSSPKLSDIRGVANENISGVYASREKHIAHVLETFQSQAGTHLRQTNQIVKKLREAQQHVQVTSNVKIEPRKVKQIAKYAIENEHTTRGASTNPASRNSKQIPGGEIGSDKTVHLGSGNPERNEAADFELRESPPHEYTLNEIPRPTFEQESWVNLSPVTPYLVIPPLNLPEDGIRELQAAGIWDEDKSDEISNEGTGAAVLSKNDDSSPRDLDWHLSNHNTPYGITLADAEYTRGYASVESVERPMSAVLEASIWAQGTLSTPEHALWSKSSVKSTTSSVWTAEKNEEVATSTKEVILAEVVHPEEQRIREHEHDQHNTENSTKQKYEAIEERISGDCVVEQRIADLPTVNLKDFSADFLRDQDSKDNEILTRKVNASEGVISGSFRNTMVQSRLPSSTPSSCDEKELCVDQQLDAIFVAAGTPFDSDEETKYRAPVTNFIVASPSSPDEDILMNATGNMVLEQSGREDAKNEVNTAENGEFQSTPASPCDASNFNLLLHLEHDEDPNDDKTKGSERDCCEQEGAHSADSEVKIAVGSDNQSSEDNIEAEHKQQRTTSIDDPDVFKNGVPPRLHEITEVTEATTSSPSILDVSASLHTENKLTVEIVSNYPSSLEPTSADLGEQNTLEPTSVDLGEQDNSSISLLEPTPECIGNVKAHLSNPRSSILEFSDEENASVTAYDALLSTSSEDPRIAARKQFSQLLSGKFAGLMNDSASTDDKLTIEAMQATSEITTHVPAAAELAAVPHAEDTRGFVDVTRNHEGREYLSDRAILHELSESPHTMDASALSCGKLNDRGNTSTAGGGCATVVNDEVNASALVNDETVEVVDKDCQLLQPARRVDVHLNKESECVGRLGQITDPQSTFFEVPSESIDAPLVHSVTAQAKKSKQKHEKKRSQPTTEATKPDAENVSRSPKRKVALDDENMVDISSSASITDEFLSSRSISTTNDAECSDGSGNKQVSLSRQASTRPFLMRATWSGENESTNSGLESTAHHTQSLEGHALDTAPDDMAGLVLQNAEAFTTTAVNAEQDTKVGKEDDFGEFADEVPASDNDCSIIVAAEPTADIQFLSPLQVLDARIDHKLAVKVLEPVATCASTSVVELISSVQGLQKCATPVETQSYTQEVFIATLHNEEDIKVESSTAIEDKTWMSSTTTVDRSTEFLSLIDQEPERGTDQATNFAMEREHDNSSEELPLSQQPESTATEPNLILSESEAVANGIGDQQSTERLHTVARQIQAQYRCFVWRRLLFDQLRFMVAKHRRQSRRAKSRRKTKKVKVIDTVAPVSSEADECPVEVLAVKADVRTTGASIEEAEKISVGHVIAEGDINVSSDVPAISVDVTVELPSPPMEDDIKSLARNDSCEYALDLFDDSNGALDVELQAQNDDNGVMVPIGTAGGQVSTNFADPQTLGTGAATPQKNEEVDNGRDSTVLQLEQEVERVERTLQLTIEPTIKLSSTNKVESSLQQVPSSVHGRFSTLTFDKEPKATDAVTMNTPKGPEEVMGSQWERYADNTTSKSWYFNPSTNISQWTTPEGASIIDNAKASSPHVIPTMQQEGAPDVEAVRPSDSKSTPEPLGTWQEFLDEASGQLFYYNAKTGESSWVPPLERCDPIGVVASPESVSTAAMAAGAASAWVMYIDPATQAPYYVNVDTLATRWEPPAEFAVASTLSPSEANTTTTADEDEYVIAMEIG